MISDPAAAVDLVWSWAVPIAVYLGAMAVWLLGLAILREITR